MSARAMAAAPVCDRCGRRHAATDAPAVDRFDPAIPAGFRAAYRGAPLRLTREAAITDMCRYRVAWASVERVFVRYSPEQRATRASSQRLGHVARQSVGEFFYWTPVVPGKAFPSRHSAASAGASVKVGA